MPIYDLILAVLSEIEPVSRNRVIDALRSRGAVSPSTARPRSDLSVPADDTWDRLIIEGRVREGPPGHFYLFEDSKPSKRQRIVGMVLFYALLVLIPIVLVILVR